MKGGEGRDRGEGARGEGEKKLLLPKPRGH